jgi:hypothetical protein
LSHHSAVTEALQGLLVRSSRDSPGSSASASAVHLLCAELFAREKPTTAKLGKVGMTSRAARGWSRNTLFRANFGVRPRSSRMAARRVSVVLGIAAYFEQTRGFWWRTNIRVLIDDP